MRLHTGFPCILLLSACVTSRHIEPEPSQEKTLAELVADRCHEDHQHFGSTVECKGVWVKVCPVQTDDCLSALNGEDVGDAAAIHDRVFCESHTGLKTAGTPEKCLWALRHPVEFRCESEAEARGDSFYACVEHYKAEAWRKDQAEQLQQIKDEQQAAEHRRKIEAEDAKSAAMWQAIGSALQHQQTQQQIQNQNNQRYRDSVNRNSRVKMP